MSAEQAARQLDATLREYPWFVSVGTGETAQGTTLFVYVKSSRGPATSKIAKNWKGFRVMIRPVGSFRAVI